MNQTSVSESEEPGPKSMTQIALGSLGKEAILLKEALASKEGENAALRAKALEAKVAQYEQQED